MIKLAILQDKRIEFINGLTVEEISSIITHAERLTKLEMDTQKFMLFNNAYTDFHEVIKNNNVQNNLSRIILELMSTFKAFLDHWETLLKRTYGKDSSNVKIFKALANEEYDNHFSYRFIYELQNYIRHVSMPNLSFSSSLTEENTIKNHLFFNKNELLANYSKWKSIIKKDLALLPETFDFIPLIDDLYESVKRINITVINFKNIEDLYLSSIELLKLNSYKPQKNCAIVIIEGEWDKPMPQKLDLRILPLDFAEYIITNVKIIPKK
jgi:hypothetical protein